MSPLPAPREAVVLERLERPAGVLRRASDVEVEHLAGPAQRDDKFVAASESDDPVRLFLLVREVGQFERPDLEREGDPLRRRVKAWRIFASSSRCRIDLLLRETPPHKGVVVRGEQGGKGLWGS